MFSVQTAFGCIRFSVRVPVLSVQITSVEPSVSTALRRLTSAPRRASAPTATASARVMTGSRPSGTLPASSPTANTTLSRSDSPAPRIASGMKASAIPTATPAISHATRRTWRSSGLGSLACTRSDSEAMRPSSVCMPVANTTPRASPPRQVRAAEHQVPGIQTRQVPVDEIGRAQHRHGLSRQRREVHLDGAGEQAHVCGDAVPLLQQDDVAGHQLGRLDPRRGAVAQHPDVLGHVACQRLHRTLGLLLLHERKRRVQQDHEQHGDGDRLVAHGQGQARRQPQQQRQRVGQLARQLTRPAAPAAAAQLIRSVLRQPALGLARGQSRG